MDLGGHIDLDIGDARHTAGGVGHRPLQLGQHAFGGAADHHVELDLAAAYPDVLNALGGHQVLAEMWLDVALQRGFDSCTIELGHETVLSPDAPAGAQRSRRRGSNETKLQGLVRISSCGSRMRSQAVRQAPDEPGSTNTRVPLATPASARDWMVELPISS